MKKLASLVLPLILIFAFGASAATASGRVALVVGNSAYSHVATLPNPRNDARAVAEAFRAVGFSVREAHDLGFDEMRRTLRDFTSEAAKAQMAIIYYAGHGIEISKQNYLIPVDAKLETDRDVGFEALPMEMLSEAVGGASLLKLVILDACRNNPFSATMKVTSANRSVGRGLARFDPAPGTLVAFAAQEGAVASDGEGKNSPFAAALVSNLLEPGLEVNFLFRRIRDSVMRETNSQQMPFTYGSLPSTEIYFRDPVKLPPVAPSADNAVETAIWGSIRSTTDGKIIEDFLTQFPQGIHAAEARSALASIQARAGTETPVAKAGTLPVAAKEASPPAKRVFGMELEAAGAIAKDLQLDGGLLVKSVEPGSQAELKGIVAGDIILEARQEVVNSLAELEAVSEASRKDGRKSLLLLLADKNGSMRFVAATLE